MPLDWRASSTIGCNSRFFKDSEDGVLGLVEELLGLEADVGYVLELGLMMSQLAKARRPGFREDGEQNKDDQNYDDNAEDFHAILLEHFRIILPCILHD